MGTSAELSRVTSVVFDLGGVLIDWDPRQIFQHHFETSAAMEEFMAEVFWRAHRACHDADAPFEQTLAPFIKQHPHYRDALNAMSFEWHRAIVGPIAETVVLLEELAARDVPLFALTNWPAQTWPPAHPAPDDYGFLGRFTDIVVSGREKMSKPEPAIYALAMGRFGLAPGEAIFVDDLAVNAQAATKAGLIGHRFVSADRLRPVLASAGLL